MLIGSDCGLNLMLGLDDSLQNVVTQTMLNQEEIFRNQVLELHRLYGIQKILMNELNLKVVSGGESTHSFVGPLSKNLKYEYLPTEMNLSQVHMICSSRSVKNHCLLEHRGSLKHQRRPLDLQLPAGYYTNDGEDLLRNGIAAEVSAKRKHGFCDDKVSSNEVLKLSLTAEADTRGKGNGVKTFKDKIICSPSQQSVCLEGSTSFRSRKNDAFDSISKSYSLTDGRLNLLERKEQGVERCQEDLSSENLSARRKLFTAHGVGELDLNKALPDESSVPSKCTSSCVSHNEVGEYGKSTYLTDLDWREPKNNHSNDSSASDRQDITRSTLTASPSKDPVSCSWNFSPKNAESEISLPDKTCRNISTSEMNVDKNKEDQHCSQQHTSQEFLEGTGSNRSPVSCKSDWTADDVSSNTKTGQCGIDIPNSNPSIEMKSQSSDPENKESAEVDITIRKGAVSLIYFSSECFAKKRKESCNVESETSECSSESYESIVLKQQECSVDEYCVSSTPFEVTSSDKKDHGVKLKRGRRMKDFRKDILPGLASLSRQEISEDIKIMELAFRSREYKKYRPKNASRSDCFSSVRSRRSRLSCVGRRY